MSPCGTAAVFKIEWSVRHYGGGAAFGEVIEINQALAIELASVTQKFVA